MKMIWGMSAYNVGGLKFNRSDNETNPSDQNLELSTGLSWQPSWGPVRMLYAIDLRDLTMKHADDTYCQSNKGTDCIWKRLHIGTEFGFFPIDSGASTFAVRAGFNQGYFTYGFELNPFIFFRGLNIQYAVYKTETGDKIGDRPDKRKVLQINFRILAMEIQALKIFNSIKLILFLILVLGVITVLTACGDLVKESDTGACNSAIDAEIMKRLYQFVLQEKIKHLLTWAWPDMISLTC